MFFRILLVVVFVVAAFGASTENVFNGEQCKNDALFQSEFADQITALKPQIHQIFDHVTNKQSGKTYQHLSDFVDKFGSRFTGTKNLENAIDSMIDLLKKEGHSNVHGEPVPVSQWIRGNEWAQMIEPRVKKLSILGLGYSVGTNNQTVEAEVIVVKSFDELEKVSDQVKGKIVVYNFDFHSYGSEAVYRGKGASRASKHGAVAAFIRSLTLFSLNTPHTGMQSYDKGVDKIPAVSITVEDAQLFGRLAQRGEKIKIRFYSENTLMPDKTVSRNTISELPGTHNPQDVVVVSGHLDSWDVGQGAMDDGGGAFISWRALSVLKSLNLQPRQTIRSILWTAEEMGLLGASKYVSDHRNESFTLAMESDIGTFDPIGITFSGKNLTSQCAVWSIMQQFPSTFNATRVRTITEGSDTEYFDDIGIPITSLDTHNERYFWYHHTEADTMTVEDAGALDRNTALWAAVAYGVASLDRPLPK